MRQVVNKKEVRKLHLKTRNKISMDTKGLYDKSICEQILKMEAYINADKVFVYYPLGSEIDILPLVREGLSEGRVFCFPKTLNSIDMEFLRINSLDDFQEGRFHVFEPITEIVCQPTTKSFMLIPGLAFDKANNRIGYGAGYYDRYLERCNRLKQKPLTIGVFYSWQEIDQVPIHEGDIPLDCIINER